MKYLYIITIVVSTILTSCTDIETNKLNRRDIETNILKELKTDLIQNLDDINSNISSLEVSENANRMIIELMENAKPYHDSLDYHFANLYPYLVFSPNETTFKYLERSGMHLISNDSIRASISNLYGVQYKIYEDYESIYFVEHYTNYIKPMFIAEFETFKFYRSFKPRNYKQFIKNKDYNRVMSYTADASQAFRFMQTGLKESVEKLLKDIDDELIKYEK